MCCCRAMLRFAGTRNIGSVPEASTKSPRFGPRRHCVRPSPGTVFLLIDGTLGHTISCRMTANISRILAAGLGPVSRSARAPPEARASPILGTIAGLKPNFGNNGQLP